MRSDQDRHANRHVAGGAGLCATTVVVSLRICRTVTITHTATAASLGASSTPAGTYSGNGSENVGTITVSSGSTLQWACQGCAAFGIGSDLSGTNVISVSSTASSGSTFVDGGTYTNVRVVSNGNWAFRITP